jgi:hypothetical protein
MGLVVSKTSNPRASDPTPVVSLEDHEGPMKKTVGFFARALDAKPSTRHDTNPAFSSALSKPKINSFSSSKIR